MKHIKASEIGARQGKRRPRFVVSAKSARFKARESVMARAPTTVYGLVGSVDGGDLLARDGKQRHFERQDPLYMNVKTASPMALWRAD